MNAFKGRSQTTKRIWMARCAGNEPAANKPLLNHGKKLTGSIVKEKLAACVNRIQTDSEELLIIKTRQSLLEALIEHVKTNHEYDVPELISLPITGGNLKYLEWIKESTRD
ncbi:Protein CutA 1, chloroplastic [Glycine soja]|uniref:Protein CutA 1, chloroplastic n=1 Tax=Glycine soja TaxID=3848 RepID=A0A445JVX0_GLYSO|nr:Protein CutA 1, chloroplastic [Glycine soja]